MPDASFLGWPFFEDAHRSLARDFDAWCRSEIAPLAAAPEPEGDAQLDEACRDLVRRLGEGGWLRHAVPGAWGGASERLEVRSLCLVRETLGRYSGLADFVFALQGLGSGPISLFGSEEQRAAWLPKVAAGRAIPAFALSEAEAGSDVSAMTTTARRDGRGGDGWVIDGEKTWISNAGLADFYIVFCRQPEAGEKAFTALLVEADNPGLRVAARIGTIAPHPLGTLAFESCRVPAGAVVGEPGRGLRVALATLDVFRSTVGAAALGFARRALDEAVAHASRRQAFGRPLAEFQMTQAKLADMATAVDASALLVYRAAWTRDAGAERVTREAAMAKLFATEAAQRVIDEAVQLLGGRGVVSGEPVERLYREVRALRIYEGTSEIQRLVIAGQVLAAADREPGGDDPMTEPSAPSAHVDTFCRDSLPPRELWPEMRYDSLPELAYPPRLNCAVELLDKMVEAGCGDRTVFHFNGGKWTYRQLLETANRIARVLVEDLGLVPGNRVLLRGPNNAMMAACWFAVLKAGGVVVCTMPLLRVRELTYIADKAKIRLALCDARVAAECEQAMSTTAAGFPREGGRVVLFHSAAAGSLESLMEGKPATFDNCGTAADDTALIGFTSGTTGQGKGTMHFHRDVLAICDCFPPYILKPEQTDIFCGSPPFAFTYGLGGILLFPMRIGASALLLEQAAPPQLLQGIQDHRATVCFTAPTAYRAMAPMAGGFDLSSLKKCVSAGETLPKPTFEMWEKATGLQIIDGIGSTEMLHIFISASGDDIRPGSTGKAVPGYEARLVDEEGNDVPLGSTGKLAVRGPTGCRYLDNLERQQAYVQDGWNLTGDSYRIDEDGYFWYQARTDDMIISSGHNIAGPEIEAVLLDHPKVAECGVVGVPDEERGQIIKAYVVLRSGFEAGPELVKELQAFVKAEIAPYKYPRAIEFVDTLPRTETGKLQRFRLRERG